MKRVDNLGFQGDVAFIRVAGLPDDAVEKADKGPPVVAHSETGHHHVAKGEGVRFYETADPMTCYLTSAQPMEVEHMRPHDTHETLELPAGTWKVRRQREHTPEGWRMVMD